MSTPRQQQGGLSITTLAIASLASVAAAIVVHKLWQGGAIVGAAITPVVVAVVSESLRRPVDRVTAVRAERRPGQAAPPEPARERPDPYGIWEADRPKRRVGSKHIKLAIATGVLAFAIGAVALTGVELVFGGNVGGGGKDTTVFGGGSKKKQEETKTETTPTGTTGTTPTETTETTPTEATETPTEIAPAPEGSTPPPGEAPPPTAPPESIPGQPPATETPAPGQEVQPTP